MFLFLKIGKRMSVVVPGQVVFFKITNVFSLIYGAILRCFRFNKIFYCISETFITPIDLLNHVYEFRFGGNTGANVYTNTGSTSGLRRTKCIAVMQELIITT